MSAVTKSNSPSPPASPLSEPDDYPTETEINDLSSDYEKIIKDLNAKLTKYQKANSGFVKENVLLKKQVTHLTKQLNNMTEQVKILEQLLAKKEKGEPLRKKAKVEKDH